MSVCSRGKYNYVPFLFFLFLWSTCIFMIAYLVYMAKVYLQHAKQAGRTRVSRNLFSAVTVTNSVNKGYAHFIYNLKQQWDQLKCNSVSTSIITAHVATWQNLINRWDTNWKVMIKQWSEAQFWMYVWTRVYGKIKVKNIKITADNISVLYSNQKLCIVSNIVLYFTEAKILLELCKGKSVLGEQICKAAKITHSWSKCYFFPVLWWTI